MTHRIFTLLAVLVTAIALTVGATSAPARQGADDPAGHVRHSGDDDGTKRGKKQRRRCRNRRGAARRAGTARAKRCARAPRPKAPSTPEPGDDNGGDRPDGVSDDPAGDDDGGDRPDDDGVDS